jgi:hypothetical protein
VSDQGVSDYAGVRAKARALHNAGLVACLVGVLVMIWGRFAAGAPPLAVWAGVALIVVGWCLFGLAIARRAAWLRAHPPTAEDS